MKIKPFPRPDWRTLTNDNAVNVETKVLLVNRRAMVAMLKFDKNGSFDAHEAAYDIHVMCQEGSGFVLVEGETAELQAGQSVLWPRDTLHQLWTEDSSMITLMIEHLYQMGPFDDE
jgi:quercetin dioxygenase-like cupin family protein